MKDDLNFSLPGDDKQKRSGNRSMIFPTVVSILVLVVLLAFVVQELLDQFQKNKSLVDRSSADEEKELARTLEDRGLNSMAAQSWMRFINRSQLGNKEKANYFYRIGKLFQEDGRYDRALEYYYRSELTNKLPDIDVELKRRKQECFKRLGNIKGLNRELEAMTSLGTVETGKNEDIVAEIGRWKITSRELDSQLDTFIEMELARYSSALSPKEMAKEKERMHDRLNTKESKLQFLNQLVNKEILNRESKERKLDQQPENRLMMDRLNREYYAQKVLDKIVQERVIVTGSDLEDYYNSHKDEFTEKEKAKICVVSVSSEEDANKAIEEIQSGVSFEECAKKYNKDKGLKESGGAIKEPVAKGSYIPGIGNDPAIQSHIFSLGEGETSEKPIASDDKFYVFKVESIVPEKVKSFSEVKELVERKKRRIKKEEVYLDFIDELKQKHEVVIHYSHFRPGRGDKESAEESKSANSP